MIQGLPRDKSVGPCISGIRLCGVFPRVFRDMESIAACSTDGQPKH